MAGFSTKLKKALLRAVEVVGTSASNLADNAKHKVAEINLESRRREILNDFCLRAYDLWQKGTKLPEPLADMLKELSELEEKLSVLRAQKYARVEDSKQADGEAQSATADNADAPAAIEPAPDATEAAEESIPADGPETPTVEPSTYESTLGETEK